MEFIHEKEVLRSIERSYEELPERLKKEFSKWAVHNMVELLARTEECDSPIEKLMNMVLERALEKTIHHLSRTFFVLHQEKIEVNGSKYRVDFCIVVETRNGGCKEFVLECDGHEFHEKTKEQAQKDKKRDRDLQGAGYIVMRFTGSEIYKNPYACAREVADIIANELLRLEKEVN
ncbi:endonuclease domain-containing protein [Bacillus weihaiensis]|uniref:endonuclease domain-containing protein n=1 Tax=Bacillus weihaiensis TaxID=1547283 RepID=UPI00235708DA|nr:DUF559 domain-containing protein [Bacillus weihaiensis]